VVGKEAPVPPEGLTPSGQDPGDLPPVSADGDTAEGLVRSTALMAVGTALSRVTGFLRVAAMAFALGVAESRLADSYNVANNIPNIVYELILGGILTSIFVPVFVQQLTTRSRTLRVPAAERAAVQDLATVFLRFFMPQIVLYGMGAVATGILNAHRRFALPMFAPILNNLVVIASFVIFALLPGPSTPTQATVTGTQRLVLAIGATAGVAVMTFALWPTLRRIGFRWRWRFDRRDPAVRSLVRLSGWAVLYVVINQIGLLVVIVLAGGARGGFTAYQAAFIFFQLPHAIFSVSIMTALLPSLSENWVRGDRADFRRDLARGIRASAFVVLPAAAGYLVLAEPIVRVLLEHGVAGARSTELVSGVLTFFAIGLFPFSAFLLCLRAFYAMQDTRTPALINVFAVGLNIVANLILFPALGVRGLALGHSLAYLFAATAAALLLRRKLEGLEGRALASGLGRILAAAALTGAAAWGAARLMSGALATDTLGGQIAQVGAGVVGGLIIFIGAALLFRIEEFELVRRTVAARRRR
jgi:putative peptidoglycan lipid II flippase